MKKHRFLTISCLALTFCTAWTRSFAQDQQLSREELESMLRERDAIIIGLQHAVNELRERVGAIEAAATVDSISDSGSILPREDSSSAPAIESDLDSSQNSSGRLFVDEAAAERALERTLVQTGALLLPGGNIEVVPSLSYAVDETDFAVTTAVGTEQLTGSSELEKTASIFNLTARFGLPLDSQIEINLPYRSVTEEAVLSMAGTPVAATDWTGRGLGDISIAFAKTLLRENGRRPDFIGRIGWGSGRGKEVDGGVSLGGGFESVSASLSIVKRRDPLALFASLGFAETRKQGEIQPGEQYSLSFGTGFAVSPDSSLFGSISHRTVGKTRISGNELVGSELSVTALGFGLSTILRRGALINVFSEIGISDDAPDFSLGFSLPMRRQIR